jgi:photosystem II stability/assembly factor-like uncharacterized protein
MQLMHHLRLLVALTVMGAIVGCHHEDAAPPPLPARLISIADKFFDVQGLDAQHAIVVGYGGKILLTADGGFSWTQAASGTRGALYKVRFVDPNNGWISGQDGILLHSSDGGKTWARQASGTNVYLFSLDFVDRSHGWAVGDKSIALETFDGGTNWILRKITTAQQKNARPEDAIASEDPVLYDVKFLDGDVGWICGEFGKLFHTVDGGKTWAGQEQSLLGQDIIDILDIPTFFGLDFTDKSNGVAVGLEGKIVRTTDAGESWKFEKVDVDYPIVDPLFHPSLFPEGSGWAVGAAGEVVHRADGATPWKRQKLGMEVVTWLRGLHWLDQNNGWIVGGYGLILHTKDGGKTWIPSLA